MDHISKVKLVESQLSQLKITEPVNEEYVWRLKLTRLSRLLEHFKATDVVKSFHKTTFKNGIVGKSTNNYMYVVLYPASSVIELDLMFPVEAGKFLNITSFKLQFLNGQSVIHQKMLTENAERQSTNQFSENKEIYPYYYHWKIKCSCAKEWTDLVDSIRFQFIVSYEVRSKWINTTEDLVNITDQISDSWLSKYYLSDELSDVAFECDNEIIPAHRLALSSKSPVFAAMLTTNMKEAIKIDDMEPETLKEFLKFFYEKANYEQQFKNINMTCSLLAAADKYQMQLLKDQCEQSLINTIYNDHNSTIKMVIYFHYLADLHHAHKLKSKALNYLIANKKSLAHTELFTEYLLKYPTLLIRLLQT